jgi:hypothetical protein
MKNFRDALQLLNHSSFISHEDSLVCENIVNAYLSTRTSTEPEDWLTQQDYLPEDTTLQPVRRSRWACEEWNDGKLPMKTEPEPEGLDSSNLSAMQMWPEASEAMLNRDFKTAARGYREAYEKSRGWHEDDSVPFTTNQQLLLELILRAEVWEMNEVQKTDA